MSELFQSVQVVQKALDYHRERHNVIASNVANVDTPGFRAQEILRSTHEAENRPLALTTTTGAHLNDRAPGGGERYSVEEEAVAPAGADGNSVALEREMSKLAANDLRYDTATRIIRHQLGMLRYAASDATQG